MAAAYVCDGCGSNMADMVLSAVGTGETKMLCLYCLYGFAHVTAMQLDGGPEMISQMNAPTPEPTPKPRKRRAKPDATADPESWPVGDVDGPDGEPVNPETGEIDA